MPLRTPGGLLQQLEKTVKFMYHFLDDAHSNWKKPEKQVLDVLLSLSLFLCYSLLRDLNRVSWQRSWLVCRVPSLVHSKDLKVRHISPTSIVLKKKNRCLFPSAYRKRIWCPENSYILVVYQSLRIGRRKSLALEQE